MLPSDAERGRTLGPLLHLLLDTNTTAADEERRAWMILDWLARTCLPTWLKANKSYESAKTLRELPEVIDKKSAGRYMNKLLRVSRAPPREFFPEGGWAGPRITGSLAANHCLDQVPINGVSWMHQKIRSFTMASIRACNRETFYPTSYKLQQSAQQLIRDLCAVGRKP